jgi:dsDNA-specific endonuclease/ATPase MutS2
VISIKEGLLVLKMSVYLIILLLNILYALIVEESVHIVIDESNNLMKRNDEDVIDLDNEIEKLAINEDKEETRVQEQRSQYSQEKVQQVNIDLPKSWNYLKRSSY